MDEMTDGQRGIFEVIGDFFGEYIFPYWPWIVLIIIGAIVLRVIIRRAAPCIVVIGALIVFSGVGISGILTWLRDRGIADIEWIPW